MIPSIQKHVFVTIPSIQKKFAIFSIPNIQKRVFFSLYNPKYPEKRAIFVISNPKCPKKRIFFTTPSMKLKLIGPASEVHFAYKRSFIVKPHLWAKFFKTWKILTWVQSVKNDQNENLAPKNGECVFLSSSVVVFVVTDFFRTHVSRPACGLTAGKPEKESNMKMLVLIS